MTLTHWAAQQAVLSARERVQRAERRHNMKELNKAHKAFIRAVAWLLREERA